MSDNDPQENPDPRSGSSEYWPWNRIDEVHAPRKAEDEAAPAPVTVAGGLGHE